MDITKRSGGFQTVIFLHFLLPVARKEDQKLALDQPQEYGKVNSVCQLCYNLSRDLGHGDMNFLWNLMEFAFLFGLQYDFGR